MNSPPENLLPVKSPRPLLGDLCGFVLVAGFAAIAMWGLGLDMSAIGSLLGSDEFARQDTIVSLGEIGDQSASAVLVISMAWVISLSCGAVDLSIFAVAALGGVVSATLINCGLPPGISLGAGALAGAVIGSINGLLVRWVPVWSFIITGAVGLVLMLGMLLVVGDRAVQIPVDAFESLLISAEIPIPVLEGDAQDTVVRRIGVPLGVTRRLIVAAIYIAVIVLLSNARADRSRLATHTKIIALCASGALAGAGGSLWLIDYGSAPVLTRPVGDLLPVATAILAGAGFYRSQKRGALAMVVLVGALVGATFFQQKVWVYPLAGWNLQLVLLIAMVLVSQSAIFQASQKASGGTFGRWLSAAGTCGGLLVTCLSATFPGSLRVVIFRAGIILWLIGAAAWAKQGISTLRNRRPSSEGSQTDG